MADGRAGEFLAKAAEPPLSAAVDAAVVLLTDIGALGACRGGWDWVGAGWASHGAVSRRVAAARRLGLLPTGSQP